MPISVIIIKELISKLAREGKTIFYCSHMMDIVEKVSDRIVLINEGLVVADGSFEELKKQQGDISLEKMFSELTATSGMNNAAEQLMSAFD
jgi:ABC-2 type transport system ATP-binding protein